MIVSAVIRINQVECVGVFPDSFLKSILLVKIDDPGCLHFIRLCNYNNIIIIPFYFLAQLFLRSSIIRPVCVSHQRAHWSKYM